jgi:VNT family MFS transporter (synaptic vesicle glycoprotein 2)
VYAYKQQAYHGETILSHRRILSIVRVIPLPLLALCISNSSDATEILMLSFLLADSKFRIDMLSSDGGEDSSSSMEGAKYLASSIFAGMLIGGTVLGFLSDRIGRRPVLLFGLVTNGIAGMCSSLSVFSPSLVSLTVWRFLAGVGIGSTVPPLFTLVSEWSPKECRGLFVTAVASFWMVGSVFVSTIAWCLFQLNPTLGLPIWRIFAAICALPSLLGALMVYNYVPESPRYLSAPEKRDYDLAAKACNRMAMLLGVRVRVTPDTEKPDSDVIGTAFDNRVVHLLTKDELLSHYHQNDTSSFNSCGNIIHSQDLNQDIASAFVSLQALYSSRLLPRTTLPLQLLWFCLSFATYGITTWINALFVQIGLLENLYINSFLFALATLPGNIVTLLYSDKVGRKKILIGSLIGAACGLVMFAITVYAGVARDDKGENVSSTARACVIVFACAFQAFGTMSWNVIDIISSELFPTKIRSAGMGLCTATGRLGGILAQCVNANLIDDTPARVLVIASISLLLGSGAPLILERDMTMEELKDDVLDGSEDCCAAKRYSDEAKNNQSLEYQCSSKPFLL